MAITLRRLASNLESLTDQLGEGANELKQKVATAILRDLLENVPVDTTAALSNFQVSLQTPRLSEIGARIPGKQGSTREASLAATETEALRVIAGSSAGEVIYITNTVDYLKYLNDGSSTQAPAGFIERSVLIGRRLVKEGLEVSL